MPLVLQLQDLFYYFAAAVKLKENAPPHFLIAMV
jgi:hypothetical protein